MTIGLQWWNGHMDLASIIGVLVFLQYWYWFANTHFLALTFSVIDIHSRDWTQCTVESKGGVVQKFELMLI